VKKEWKGVGRGWRERVGGGWSGGVGIGFEGDESKFGDFEVLEQGKRK